MNKLEVYQHYGIEEDRRAVAEGKLEGVDFLIGREEDIEESTNNMAGFGTGDSQRVVIEYDRGYGYFVAKRYRMKYGASVEAPQKTDQFFK